jgi:S-adenosylmethionine/arginine decarboxylase-like enzyme
MSTYWGYHLALDCSGCDHASITSEEVIYKFTKQLVKDIDMIAYGEPQIVHFGEGDKSGFTMLQLISTSCISCHFVNESDTMYLDVFSCKPYDTQVVIDLVVEYFGAKKMNKTYFERQAPAL